MNRVKILFFIFLIPIMGSAQVTDWDRYWNEMEITIAMTVEGGLGDQVCYQNIDRFSGCIEAASGLASALADKDVWVSPIQIPGMRMLNLNIDGFNFYRKSGLARLYSLDFLVRALWMSQIQFFTVSRPSFTSLFNQLEERVQAREGASATIARAVNDFYRIAIDAHTFNAPAQYYLDISTSGGATSTNGFLGIFIREFEDSIYILNVNPRGPSHGKLAMGDKIIRANGETELSEVLHEIDHAQTIRFVLEDIDGNRRRETVTRGFYQDMNIESRNIEVENRNLGYIDIDSFEFGTTCRDFAQQVNTVVRRNGAEGLILDLRDNRGGQVPAGLCVQWYFLSPGSIEMIYVRLNSTVDHFLLSDRQVNSSSVSRYKDLPLVILINGETSSISELIALNLQAYGKAIIIGERSYGKGSEQEWSRREENGDIYFSETTGIQFAADGTSPQIQGVRPDFTVRPFYQQILPTAFNREIDSHSNLIRFRSGRVTQEFNENRNQAIESCLESRIDSIESELSPNAIVTRDLQLDSGVAALNCFLELGLSVNDQVNIATQPLPNL